MIVNLILSRYFMIFVVSMVSILPQSIYAQDKNTVLLYTFDSGDGDVVKDLSGNGNDGTLMGNTDWDDGNIGNALVFGGDGPRDFVDIPDSDSLDLVTELTIEMWVYLNAYSISGGTGVTKESSYKIGPRSNKRSILRMTTTENDWVSAIVIGEKPLPLDTWFHIAGTYDANSGDGKLYFNGELDSENNIGGDIVPNERVVWLGRGSNPFLDGYIDEVRISNVVRPLNEIQHLMNAGIEGVLSVSPNDKLATSWGKLKSKL